MLDTGSALKQIKLYSLQTRSLKAAINTYNSLTQLLKKCRQLAQQRRHRYLLHISGEQQWSIRQANQALQLLNEKRCLWIGDQPPNQIAHSTNPQALSHLGCEYGLLIYNAFSGFDPDAFGAVSGTLGGGGLLILLTPPSDEWAEYPDPEAERIAVANYNLPKPSLFFKRLSRVLASEQSVAQITADQILFRQPETVSTQQISRVKDRACRTSDQADAVEAIIHVVKGHRKRPLVLSSDRGRGKSSALGIAAARLIEAGHQRILVTASRQRAVETLFEMAARELGTQQSGVEPLRFQDGVIEYMAPDLLISETAKGDLLLVDEAAAIPTPILKTLLHLYPRIVFSTTVHGYEGTGLGFNHRFKKHLQQERPQWREIFLRTPIRWAADDPLEQLVFRMLALDAEPAQPEKIEALDRNALSLVFPSSEQLLEHENRLQQLFGLLVLAHYRTTPRDLWHLLDGPNLQTVILIHQEQVVAVALLASEGGFSAELAEQIWLGRRRPRGHLLAQSLSAHLGLRSASTLKGLRIMRIAVHPVLQNRGLGQHLLKAIKEHATRKAYDYLGVSFGATTKLIRFWQKNDMQAVRLGLHAGASSSQQSVMCIDALSQSGEALLYQARARYAIQTPTLLCETMARLSAELVLPLLKEIETPLVTELTEQDWLDVVTYAFANRGYDYTQSTIQTLCLKALSEGLVNKADSILLIKRVLQKKSWLHCATALGFSGRKAVDRQLRKIMGKLILQFGNDSIVSLARKITSDIQP